MYTISKPIQEGAILRKSTLTIDKLHPLLEKKCAHGILENIQHGSQVLLVSSLTIMVFYCSLHLEARTPPQTALHTVIKECKWNRNPICRYDYGPIT